MAAVVSWEKPELNTHVQTEETCGRALAFWAKGGDTLFPYPSSHLARKSHNHKPQESALGISGRYLPSGFSCRSGFYVLDGSRC